MKKKHLIFLLILAFFAYFPLKFAEAKTPAKAKVVAVKKSISIKWTSGALKELNKVPRHLRTAVKAKFDRYAIDNHIEVITAQIYNDTHI